MPYVEFEDKSVEEAIAVACQQLQLSSEQLHIEILAQGSSGIFGIMGAKKAKIRVTPKKQPDTQLAAKAEEILSSILAFIETPATIESNIHEDRINLNIISDGTGLLIGKHGKTLDALQYLVNKILQRSTHANIPVVVDTENYRAKRIADLEDLALQLSARAKKSKCSQTTQPLNAHDRRIIHLALKNEREVCTKSQGDGFLRTVTIYPAQSEGQRELN